MLQPMMKNVATVLQAMEIGAAAGEIKMLQPPMTDVTTGETICYNR